MKIISKISIATMLVLLITSCKIDINLAGISGNRNVTKENRKVNNNFTKIKASNGLDVYVTQGKKASVTVEADENLQEIILTEVINGVLKIHTDKNIRRAKSKKIIVIVPSLEGITATSGADVVSENTIKSSIFEANASSGANLKLDLAVTDVSSSSSSGADIRLSGTAESYNASASSGSSTKAYNLIAKEVTVRASSGANIDVHATEKIDAKATSGGDIDYKGNPKRVRQKDSSGGSVSAH